MLQIKQCPVCWGEGVVCVGLKDNLEPLLEPCIGCEGTGWLAYKEGLTNDTTRIYFCGRCDMRDYLVGKVTKIERCKKCGRNVRYQLLVEV